MDIEIIVVGIILVAAAIAIIRKTSNRGTCSSSCGGCTTRCEDGTAEEQPRGLGDRTRLPILLVAATLLVSTAWPSHAHAEKTYLSTRQVLKSFFPRSKKVSYQRLELSKARREVLASRLGYKPAKSSYVFFVAKTGDHVDGYALIDDQPGQHRPITFAVELSPGGVVRRLEIMAYREQRGDEIRDARFRAQFKGKSVADPLRANVDIDCVSGATISSQAMVVGVRRAVVLFEELSGGDRRLTAR